MTDTTTEDAPTTCAECGEPIDNSENRMLAFFGTADGKYIRIVSICLECWGPVDTP